VRYTPSGPDEQSELLKEIGVEDFGDLLQGIPEHLRMDDPIAIPEGISEMEVRAEIEGLAAKNRGPSDLIGFAGGGAYDHFIPSAIDSVISRSEFTTAYTPYQSEVSQGTLQVIYEFQSLVAELMGMDVANASLYDGAHAVAEAMLLAYTSRESDTILVSDGLNPHFRKVIETYAAGLSIELRSIPLASDGRTDATVLREALTDPAAGFILSQPNFFGCLEDAAGLTEIVKSTGGKKAPLVIASVYPISLGVIAPPGEWGADVATAEGQSLGLPLSLGGPYLGLFTCSEEFIRRQPGRIIGRTLDRDGRESYVLTLQTREQHIRRQKATSNICTNQGLCAAWATVWMTLLGPDGLREVARQCTQKAHYLAGLLNSVPGVGLSFPDTPFFNEFTLSLPLEAGGVLRRLADNGWLGGIDLNRFGEGAPGDLLISVTESRTRKEIDAFASVFTDIVTGGE